MKDRHYWFRCNLIGNVLHPVYTYEDAISELAKHEFDMIFLDHDLADEHYDTWAKSQQTNVEYFETLENTGYDVARWMVDNSNNPQAQIIIHSCNEAGSKRMLELLLENGYNGQCVSFPNLRDRLINHEK